MSDQQKDVTKMSVIELKAAIFDVQESIRQSNMAIEILVKNLNEKLQQAQAPKKTTGDKKQTGKK